MFETLDPYLISIDGEDYPTLDTGLISIDGEEYGEDPSTTARWPQEGDVLLYQTNDNGEINLNDGQIEMNGGLETAVYNSIFGGNEDDDGSKENLLEWWGNKLETDPVRKIRSETQNLLRSIPATSSNLIRIEDAVKRDLNWFIMEKVASTVEAVASIPAANRVAISVTINASGEELEFKYLENWKGSL